MEGVSLIVPIYNTEKFLEKCLDSIINQTFENVEILLVDDGSTDCSGKICDKYQKSDARIKVIHKRQNEGLMEARITGIKNASSNWIGFVDADDWIDESFLQEMMGEAIEKQADIVVGGCVQERGEDRRTIINHIEPGIYQTKEERNIIYEKMLHYQGFYQFGILPYLWNKLFRREILRECYTEVDTSICEGEDVAIVFPYLLKAHSIVVNRNANYHYRIHKCSMTSNKSPQYYSNVAKLYLTLNNSFKKNEYYDKLLPQLDQYMRMMIWQGAPEKFILSQKFCFPFQKVPQGSKVILYGAGNVGKTYFYQLKQTQYCEVIAWIDKKYEDMLGVEAPEVIYQKEYDYIVIAIENATAIEQITQVLKLKNVLEEKILF